MKNTMMAAAALMLLMTTAVALTGCSREDNPSTQTQTVRLVESKFSTPDYGMSSDGRIYAGSYTFVLETVDPDTELLSDDFTVSTKSKERALVPGWPTELSNASEPEAKLKGIPFKRPDGKWTVKAEIFMPYTTQKQQLTITLRYKGKALGSALQMDYVNPINFSYEGCTDGYLYIGQTYPMDISYYNENKLFDYKEIIATGSFAMKPAHKGEFEVGYNDENGKPYVKILDTFTFTDEEKAAGFAVICPSITTFDEELFQVVPVKVVL